MQLEFIVFERPPQILLESASRLQRGVHFGLEAVVYPATFRFCVVERDIRRLQQVIGSGRIVREQRSADADPAAKDFSAEFEGLMEELQQALAERRGAFGRGGSRLDDREFVPAETGNGVLGANRRQQPLRDGSQKLVAGGMPERVVDFLETVEIEAEHRDRSAACLGLGHRLAQTVLEQHAIRNSRQGIVMRHVLHLIFGTPALHDLACELCIRLREFGRSGLDPMLQLFVRQPQRFLGSLARDLRLDAGKCDRKVDRFRHIVVCTQRQRCHGVGALPVCGHHDDGQGRGRMRLADGLQHLDAVHVGHHDVEQDQVERLLRDQLQSRTPARGLDHLETAPYKTARENDAVVGDIVDDEKTRLIG